MTSGRYPLTACDHLVNPESEWWKVNDGNDHDVNDEGNRDGVNDDGDNDNDDDNSDDDDVLLMMMCWSYLWWCDSDGIRKLL